MCILFCYIYIANKCFKMWNNRTAILAILQNNLMQTFKGCICSTASQALNTYPVEEEQIKAKVESSAWIWDESNFPEYKSTSPRSNY